MGHFRSAWNTYHLITTERVDEIVGRLSRHQSRPGMLYDRIGTIQANLHNDVFANEWQVEIALISAGRVSGTFWPK